MRDISVIFDEFKELFNLIETPEKYVSTLDPQDVRNKLAELYPNVDPTEEQVKHFLNAAFIVYMQDALIKIQEMICAELFVRDMDEVFTGVSEQDDGQKQYLILNERWMEFSSKVNFHTADSWLKSAVFEPRLFHHVRKESIEKECPGMTLSDDFRVIPTDVLKN